MDAMDAQKHEQAADEQGVSFSEYVRQNLPNIEKQTEATA